MLSPQAQSASGGQGGYDRFYGEMRSVTLGDVRLSGDNTVSATVRFVRTDGSTTNEPYRFVVGTTGDGTTIIESFTKL